MSKRLADLVLLGLLITLAVLLYFSAADFTGIAQKTSAHYVRFLAVFIGVLALAQWIMSFRNSTIEKLVLSQHPLRFYGLLALLIAYGVVFEWLGFFLATAVFVPVGAVLLGYRNPLIIATTTLGVLAFVYIIFVQLLSVQLPGLGD